MVKHLRRRPPCACKSLILRLLQEVSEIQTTRRKIVEKSFTQKVFFLTIFHGKSISFFIYFEKYFFHLVSFIFRGFVETSDETHRSIFSFFTFFEKFRSHFDFAYFIVKSYYASNSRDSGKAFLLEVELSISQIAIWFSIR